MSPMVPAILPAYSPSVYFVPSASVASSITVRPYFFATRISSGMAAMLPNTCTTTMALMCAPVRLLKHWPSRSSAFCVRYSSTKVGQMHRLSPQPIKMGSAPA